MSPEKKPIHQSQPITTLDQYYQQPELAHAALAFLGCPEEYLTAPGHLDLTNTGRFMANLLLHTLTEYLAINNPSIYQEKHDPVGRTIKTWELPSLLRRNPNTGLYMSLWQINQPELPEDTADALPSRTILFADIEYYHNQFPGKFLQDQLGTYQLLEPAYQAMLTTIEKYSHLPASIVVTGRGYHLLTQIPYRSPAMPLLIKAGNFIEDPVREFQAHIPPAHLSKRDRVVPEKAELAHKGAARVMQYLVLQMKQLTRQNSSIPVHFSDIGEEGIAFDETPMTHRHLGMAKTGVLGSIYEKPSTKVDQIGPHVVNQTRTLLRITRYQNGSEFAALPTIIDTRQSFSAALSNLAWSQGVIPDGSSGLIQLIQEYFNSSLRQLHLSLDLEQGDPPELWPSTYRDYHRIKKSHPEIAWHLDNANPALLQPHHLRYFIHYLFEKWGGLSDLRITGHIRTFLRSIYEDPHFNWGQLFAGENEAARHAEGWVTTILAERFT